MAHVYKPTYTTPVPRHATPCTHRKKPAVRWKGRGGVVRVGVLCPDNPARCLVESSRWYACYRDAAGDEHHVPGYTDRAATEAMLAELVKQSARIASGLLPAEAARERLSLAELLDRWHDHLVADGCVPKHARTQRTRVSRVAAGANADRVAALTPSAVSRAIAAVRAELKFSTRTAGHYLAAAKAFTRWAHLGERHEPADPLAGVPGQPNDQDPTFVRRSLLPDEFDRLLAATRTSPVPRYGLSGPERAVLYSVAASTGLRAAELASLTTASFDLPGGAVSIPGRDAKNRQADRLPLPESLVPHLRAMLRGRKPHDPVWPDRTGNASSVWWNKGADMIGRDLEAAGLRQVDDAGRVFDFHALRVQYATDLERAGVSLVRAQKLMRHSTPALTAKVYTKPGWDELAADVNKLRRG